MNIISPILDEEAICDKTEYCMEHNLNGYIIWEVSGDLMPDLSTPLIDAVHHKLSDPSLNCKDTFAYDKSTFSGYSVVPGIPKPVTASTSIGDGDGAAGGQAAMACPSIFYWGLSQYNGCTGYFNCVNGSPDQNSLIICEEDTLYDEVSFKCVDASLVSCSEESTSPVIYPSSSASESTSHSDKITGLECPSSYFWGKLQYNGCQGFFICVNGVAREDSLIICEDGTLYNEQSSQCAEASQVQCSEEPLVTSEPEPLQQESTIQQFSSTLKDPDSDVVIIDTEDNIIPITQPRRKLHHILKEHSLLKSGFVTVPSQRMKRRRHIRSFGETFILRSPVQFISNKGERVGIKAFLRRWSCRRFHGAAFEDEMAAMMSG